MWSTMKVWRIIVTVVVILTIDIIFQKIACGLKLLGCSKVHRMLPCTSSNLLEIIHIGYWG